MAFGQNFGWGRNSVASNSLYNPGEHNFSTSGDLYGSMGGFGVGTGIGANGGFTGDQQYGSAQSSGLGGMLGNLFNDQYSEEGDRLGGMFGNVFTDQNPDAELVGGKVIGQEGEEVTDAGYAGQDTNQYQPQQSAYTGTQLNPYTMDLSDLGYNTVGNNQGQEYSQSQPMGNGYNTPQGGETTSNGNILAKGAASATGDQTAGIFESIPVIGPTLDKAVEGVINPGAAAAGAYGDIMGPAMQQQKELTERGASFQQPYIQGGGIGMEQLTRGALTGEFDPGQFSYGGQGPESGSIESFMKDDPSYAFELAEGQKAIDRGSAAGGRFGGGQTAKELMNYSQGLASKNYGQRFNRAAQERDAQRYAEEQGYGRDVGQYGLERDRLDAKANLFSNLAGRGAGAANVLTGTYGGLGSSMVSSAQQQALAEAAAAQKGEDSTNALIQGGLSYLSGGLF